MPVMRKIETTAGGMSTTRHATITLAMLTVLYALGFTNLFLRGSLGILSPALTAEMQLTPTMLSLVASSFFFAYAIMQIPTGMLLDRFGPRATLSALLLFTTIGAATFAISESAYGLIAARVLMGIGCAGIFTGAFYVLNRWVAPERLVTQSGIMNSMSSIGGLCATTPLAAMVAIIGWRESYWIFTAGVIVLLMMVALVIRDVPAGQAPPVSKSETPGDVFRGVAEAVRQPGMKRLIFAGIPLSAQTTLLGVWAAPYLRDVHSLDDIARGNVLLSMAVCSMFGHVIYGFVARAVNSVRTVIFGGMCLIIGSLTALSLLVQPPVLMVTGIFCVISIACMYPMVVFAHSRGLVPSHLVGRGIAVANMGIMTAIAVSQMLFGYVVGLFPAEASGGSPEVAYRAAFGILAVMAIVSAMIYGPVKDAKLRA